MKIGEKIKQVRKSENISRKALSEKIGLSQRQLCRYENNEVGITVNSLKAISDALNFDFFLYLSKDADFLDRNALSETLEMLDNNIKEIDNNVLQSKKMLMKSFCILNGLNGCNE